MKVLLVSDIHANWPALQAIARAHPPHTYDVCLFLGDLVDYATDAGPCIEWVRKQAAHAIRGNHDHAVAQRVPARTGLGFRKLAAATRPIHWRLLDAARLKYLGRLPVTRHVRLFHQNFFLVHATPRDPLDEYLGNDESGWRSRLRYIKADFVCVGHTHLPFHLDLGSTQVINPGSVGQPRDGDPRASCATIEDGRISFHRVEYDIPATVEHMRACGMPNEDIEFAEAVLRSGGKLSRLDLTSGV